MNLNVEELNGELCSVVNLKFVLHIVYWTWTLETHYRYRVIYNI